MLRELVAAGPPVGVHGVAEFSDVVWVRREVPGLRSRTAEARTAMKSRGAKIRQTLSVQLRLGSG